MKKKSITQKGGSPSMHKSVPTSLAFTLIAVAVVVFVVVLAQSGVLSQRTNTAPRAGSANIMPCARCQAAVKNNPSMKCEQVECRTKASAQGNAFQTGQDQICTCRLVENSAGSQGGRVGYQVSQGEMQAQGGSNNSCSSCTTEQASCIQDCNDSQCKQACRDAGAACRKGCAKSDNRATSQIQAQREVGSGGGDNNGSYIQCRYACYDLYDQCIAGNCDESCKNTCREANDTCLGKCGDNILMKGAR